MRSSTASVCGMEISMILDEIAAKTVERIEGCKRSLPLSELKAQVRDLENNTGFPFERALAKPGMSFICEVKKASPSKGVIAENFPYIDIAREYEQAGADAMSILTEPFYFKGSDDYLARIRGEVSIPLLRKDFTVDEYMLYQAKRIGADAVLLICAILSPMQLSEYRGIADELGLSALVEAHDEREIEMAVGAGARIIGVNNRNLKDFTVDIDNSGRMRELVPRDILFVSESGMKTRADIARLEENGTDAVLIGETLMRSPDKAAMLGKLRGDV
jgi:indole-3-glycerol phosphate synthase